MEVLRVLSPPPAGRTNGSGLKSKSPLSKSSRSDGQENTPPLHPNLELPLQIQSPSISKSHRLSVSIPKTNSVLKLEEASIDPLLCHSDASVKVAVRVLSANENNRIVHKVSDQALTIGDRTFNFHSVFGPQANQVEVFESIGVPLVHNALAGYNTSLVSYGQTGTGKTHTMWGPPSAMFGDNSLSAKMGLVPRFFRMLFSEIEKRKEASGQKQINYQCRCSFLEIYNEQINDLLDPTQRDLQIREDDINGIHVENLTDEYVTCEEDVAQMLIKGLSNRKIGATSMNSKSSRSHVMFNFVLESWSKQPSSSSFSSSKSSRITFVDLAGLDMNESEGATKQCTKEERFVKKSLSRLGKLVNILSEAAILGKDQKVSYLGSSLTYLLQDTLGGNSKVTFLCHISSDMRSKSAILSTLRFGERAKHIQNTPIINEISEDDVNGLSDQIRQLKEELIRAKSSSNSPSESFKGFNARRNLNLLRVSLNRSLILPRIDMESDEEDLEEADEEDVAQLCTQITNLHSSSSDEATTLEEILETNTEVSPMKEPEPTLCSSPRIHIKPRKSIMSSLGLLSVAKDEIGGSGSLRSSIQSTKLSPTESLAASLHRGLNIIEEHDENNNSNPRKSFVSLSFEHLALRCQSIDSSQAPHSSDESRNFVCSSCKKLVQGKEAESKNDLCMQLVPVIENQDEENGSTKGESNASANGSKREKELEALCAEQEAKIKHLTSLVELRRQGGVMQQSFTDGIKITESLRIGESENMTPNETEEYCLLEKIRNGVTETNDEVEKERENWMESESKWICLTEELRQDLESSRIYAEKKEAELVQEKSCNAELEDALHRSILGHSRIVEHYADLQEGYNDLLERHRRVMEGINEVKRAALKAGKKGGGTSMAFAAALSAELSNVRIDREKERAQLKEQNRRLRIQLRDTAEAVHAAGELLVRLREAEEALSRSQEKCGGMEQEKEKLRKQMEKMKKKHMLDMATMKNYLAESRLPESALESYYHTEEEAEIVQEPARTHDNQSWRSAFAPAFE